MFRVLEQWSRPLRESFENWRARGDALATCDVAIRQRRRRLVDLEETVASLVTRRDEGRAAAGEGSSEYLSQLEVVVQQAERALADHRASLDQLGAERAALEEELRRAGHPR